MRLKFRKDMQRRLLKEFVKKKGLSITNSAKILKVGVTTLKEWIKEKYTLPQSIFEKICELEPSLHTFERAILERLPDNWGQVKGGRVRVEKVNNIHAFMQKLREVKKEKRSTSSKCRKSKIRNPILEQLIREKVNLYHVLAVCLLTDGSLTINGNHYRISYFSKDVTLKNFVKALLMKLSDFTPNETKDANGVFMVRVSDINLGKKLIMLSPSFKKSPSRNQEADRYFEETQPTLQFVKNSDKRTKIWCIRVAFSTDGCISMTKNGRCELNLSCQHPKLAKEWIEILGEFKINAHLGKSKKSWSGISGVRIYDITSIKNFKKIGGFLPGVKISGKSKRFKGMTKHKLLMRIVGEKGRVAYG